MIPVVNETKFWRQFTKHESFIRRVGDKEIVWSESLRPEVSFFALVMAVMVVGLVNSLDGHLFRQFQSRCNEPVFKYFNVTFRLICALDGQEKPTLDTLRASLVTYHILFQSRASWTSNVFCTLLTQAALTLELDLDPPPDCPNDIFFDRMNLWASISLHECCSALKSGRASIIKCDNPLASPSFLTSNASWDQASMDGPWSYLQKVRHLLFFLFLFLIRLDLHVMGVKVGRHS